MLCIYNSSVMTMNFDWDNDKNEKLLAERGISLKLSLPLLSSMGC